MLDPRWPGKFLSALDLDRTTLGGYLAPRAPRTRGSTGSSREKGRIGRVNGAAGFAVESLQAGDSVTSIKGGNDRLPYAFAAALGPRVKYRSEVVRITQDRRGVTIGFKDGTGRHEVRADRASSRCRSRRCAGSTSHAGFSHKKMDAIRRLRYMAAARCSSRPGPASGNRSPAGRVAQIVGRLHVRRTDVEHQCPGSPMPPYGMVHAYMFDTRRGDFTATDTGASPAMRRLFREAPPGIDDQLVGVAHQTWHEDKWAGGADGLGAGRRDDAGCSPPCAGRSAASTSPASTPRSGSPG